MKVNGQQPVRSAWQIELQKQRSTKLWSRKITLDVDGALSFDLRLSKGWLVLAELDPDGTLDASIYDDRQGILIKRLPHTTDSELIAWF